MSRGRPKGLPKSGGKPKGFKDAKTIAWEQIGEYLVQAGSSRALEIMMKSNDRDFMLHFNNLLEYFKPKQQRVTQETNLTVQQPIIIDWSDGDSNKSD